VECEIFRTRRRYLRNGFNQNLKQTHHKQRFEGYGRTDFHTGENGIRRLIQWVISLSGNRAAAVSFRMKLLSGTLKPGSSFFDSELIFKDLYSRAETSAASSWSFWRDAASGFHLRTTAGTRRSTFLASRQKSS
jgi:hypothetical protein